MCKNTAANSDSLPYHKVKLRRLRITLWYSKRVATRYAKILGAQDKSARGQKNKMKIEL
jgi:hypothetical protein